MSTFTVTATLMHPDRERSVDVDFLIDTGATYTLLPSEIVGGLGLVAAEELPATLASGERVVYRLGEVRLRLRGRERTTVFLEGPPGVRPLMGAFTLEGFSLAADPVNQRLVPAPPALL
jgi:clan AA aspartic protease